MGEKLCEAESHDSDRRNWNLASVDLAQHFRQAEVGVGEGAICGLGGAVNKRIALRQTPPRSRLPAEGSSHQPLKVEFPRR